MFDDLEPTRKKTAYVLGQIARLGAVRKQKSASQSAADALFRKPD